MSKKELAEKLGFNFDEVKDVLSEETLKSFEQKNTFGGDLVFESNCIPTEGEICQIQRDGDVCTIDPFGATCAQPLSECSF